MEMPPELPISKPPLGRQFYLLLIGPLILITVAFCFAEHGTIGGLLMALAAVATLGSSIVLAGRLSRRMSKTGAATIGAGILWFLALQAFYGVFFFVGCTTAILVS